MNTTSDRLWDKGASIDALVHRFTVGDDPHWDPQLVHWDCVGSAAHVRTLERAQLADCRRESRASDRGTRGRLTRSPPMADSHHAETGGLPHRHRGPPYAAAAARRGRRCIAPVAERSGCRGHASISAAPRVRLVRRDPVGLRRDCSIAPAATATSPCPATRTCSRPCRRASASGATRTSKDCWNRRAAVSDLLDRLDCCPLGTAAGFGVPISLDRRLTARLLGFSRIQRSPIDVQNVADGWRLSHFAWRPMSVACWRS